VGVLVLIIILTGLDASQIRMLIPTPMQYESDKRPVFIEARGNRLYRIPILELQQLADEGVRDLGRRAEGNMQRLMQLMQEIELGTEGYQIDLSYFMVGQFAIRAIDGPLGYELIDWENESPRDWYGSILSNLNPEEELIAFLVRDDSFDVFKRARHLAWTQNAAVSYELLDADEPIRFGMLGKALRPQ